MVGAVSAVFAFVGGWLLVAGPVYQASVELRAQPDLRPELASATRRTAPRIHVSVWWWFLPPAALVLHWMAGRRFRRAALGMLTASQVEGWVRAGDKATGWWLVAVGGLLLACHETERLITELDLSPWALVPLIAVALVTSIGFTVVRQLRTARLVPNLREP